VKKILCLSPHTDDVELGCGGTIARLLEEGNDVYIAVFSVCEKSLPAGFQKNTLKNECENSMRILGVPLENVFFFDYEVRVFSYKRQEILENLVLLKKMLSPDMVFIPSLDDYHQDHKTVAEEGIRCFKNNCTVLSYELIWNNTGFKNQIYFCLEERHVEKKINSLREYKSQMHRPYTSSDFINALSLVRGVQNGVNLAEAFEVIRYKI
jgi:LmbE family N-acetylglucosaminyl deacetylase